MPILIDPVATHARTKPAALAVGDLENGRRWSYRELDIAIDHAAAWLVERLGPATGRRVATLCQNSPEMLILQLACTRAGAIFAPLNWRLAEPELRGLCADCEPSLLFCDGRFADVARAVSDASCTVFDLDAAPGRLVSIVGESASGPPHEARRPFDSCATLLYTSGTSGRPKGVIVTEEMAFWGCTNFILGNDVSFRSVFLCDMPMFHTAGLYAAVRTPLIAGGTVLISSGFDAIRTRQRLADPALGVTHYFSVPQMAQMMWQAPGFDPVMLRGLTVYAMGGAPNPAAQIERFVRAGIRMSDGFGMSETGSNFGMPVADFDVILAKAGSCGLPYLAVQARIVDEAGSDLPPGEAGELWLRGPSITSGYWNRPEKTAKAFKDGWFRTGDAAYRDVDGFYFLIDRKKDMYISGGENVYPAEVEAVVLELDSVAEVAVIGVPDARWGEVGRAYVLARAGIALESDTVIAHCRARLAKYKIPASVVITGDIPRTASGKVQKQLLKARALDELEKR